jgi:hypothetical protein
VRRFCILYLVDNDFDAVAGHGVSCKGLRNRLSIALAY